MTFQEIRAKTYLDYSYEALLLLKDKESAVEAIKITSAYVVKYPSSKKLNQFFNFAANCYRVHGLDIKTILSYVRDAARAYTSNMVPAESICVFSKALQELGVKAD